MFYKISKRVLDITVSIFAIIIFSPILITLAVLIKFFDGAKGPVFVDINDRVGRNKKLFFMYKFRSMVVGAHVFWENHPELEKLEKEWKKIGKLPIDRDPRITWVGKIIRKTDLDELPQFFNVLKGDMSIVGPRAPYSEELDRYVDEFPEIKENVDKVFSVKPGITGAWQTSGRNEMTIPDRFALDAGYASQKSILKDIFIIIKTPFVMISRVGAFE